MITRKTLTGKVILVTTLLVLLFANTAPARMGGAGGGEHHTTPPPAPSPSHDPQPERHYNYTTQDNSNTTPQESNPFSSFMGMLIIIAFIYLMIRKIKKGNTTQSQGRFPAGLTPEKIKTSFLEMQQAWQNQDLGKVRKWMSDGVYQRLTAQFTMMQKLSQRNYLSNIRISNINAFSVYTDGAYQVADIAISFTMDDKFVSEKYPLINESFIGDSATEYWTYIKRIDSKHTTTDMYSSNNCPNCGASLENKLGEVSRCSACNTLVNNADYDWILSEITQKDDYGGKSKLLNDLKLKDLAKNDPLFSIQRMEDVASNVFMQIMEVLTGDNDQKLSRFADKRVIAKILQQKAEAGRFVFDRLYLNEVTLSKYDTVNNKLNLYLELSATYQRVQPGVRLVPLDAEMGIHDFTMILSKDLSALSKSCKEIAFSYECPSCGAPYNDTTNDNCSYCEAPVVDTTQNWVLTDFEAY